MLVGVVEDSFEIVGVVLVGLLEVSVELLNVLIDE